jgi:hypothetical protein
VVKKIRTMCLEEKSILDEGILKFPVIGELSIRQLIIILIPTIITFKLTQTLGTIPLITLTLTTASITLFIAKKNTKGFKPEEQLLYILTQKPKTTTKTTKEKTITEIKEEKIETIKPDEIVLIAGVLKDPSTGEPIPNAQLQLNINGTKVATVRTDTNGTYRIYYTFTAPTNTVELLYENKTIAKKTIIVKK